MKKEIKLLFDNLKNKKRNNKIIRNVTITLSCFVALITLYILMSPAITLNTVGEYKLYLKDTNLNDNYTWKTDNGYQTSIGLNLNYVDTSANAFAGKNITIDVNNNIFTFDKSDSEVINILKENEIETILVDTGKYIFDHAEVNINNKWEQLTNENTIWCQNSLSETEPIDKDYGFKGTYGIDKTEYVINDKVEYKLVYIFEAKEEPKEENKTPEVQEKLKENENVNNTEQSNNNIDTQNNLQQEVKENENNLVNNNELNKSNEPENNKEVVENKETETDKKVEENKGTTSTTTENTVKVPMKSTAPKTTLKSPRAALSKENSVSSLGTKSGIKFGLYDYNGTNAENGVNANGLYEYFSFRGNGATPPSHMNEEFDNDGFGENRAKVESKLDANDNPVFKCKRYDANGNVIFNCGDSLANTSLGYLFGASTNAKGTTTDGVTPYNPNNTPLQKETVDGVDYYYYDSNRNAVDYDTVNQEFIVRNYKERGASLAGYTNESSRYEFLPFNYKSGTSSNPKYDYEDNDINHWYGMTMEFEFYMPKNGTINGKDMIFSFSGDDDVWVFIDDVLVLDLGGTHGAVDGNINFRTGAVNSHLNWNSETEPAYNTTIKQMFQNAGVSKEWNSSGTTFADYTKHTLKFFYLERGAAVANCKIRFNIPVLPSGSLSVQKQFEGVEKYADDYEFVIYDVTSGSPVPNGTKYTIGETEYTINNNEGKFTLKNNEVAIFVSKTEQDDPNGEYLRSSHKYYVRESSAGEHAVSHSCKLDNTNCPSVDKTPEFTMNPELKYLATFINKTKTYNLKLTKEAINSSEGEKFDFKITMKDENGDIVDISKLALNFPNGHTIDQSNKGLISFKIEDDQSITIGNIPINTVIKIQEVDHDGYHASIKSIVNGKEVPLVESDTYTIDKINDNKEIKVYNTPGVILPETGGIGTLIYTIIGLSLMIISITYGYTYFYKSKEGGQ